MILLMDFVPNDSQNEQLTVDEKLKQQITDLKVGLEEITADVYCRLKELDPSFVSGIANFIKRYNLIKGQVPSTSKLATAFHSFGTEQG